MWQKVVMMGWRDQGTMCSPDTKATFSFSIGRTSAAFKPSFRKVPAKHKPGKTLEESMFLLPASWTCHVSQNQTGESTNKETQMADEQKTLTSIEICS